MPRASGHSLAALDAVPITMANQVHNAMEVRSVPRATPICEAGGLEAEVVGTLSNRNPLDLDLSSLLFNSRKARLHVRQPL